MSFIAAAVIGAGAIGAIGSYAAGSEQAGGQEQAAQTQQNMFNTINGQQQPYIQGGYSALNALLYGLGIGGNTGTTGSTTSPGTPPTMGGGVIGGNGQNGQNLLTNGPSSSGVGSNPSDPTNGGTTDGYGNPIGSGGGGSQDYSGGNSAQLQQMMNPQQGSTAPPVQGAGGVGGGTSGIPAGYFTQTFDPNNLNGNPAYQFALQQGGNAVRNADTPTVGALSGAALKDLTNFNVGTANQYESQYYNQFQTNQNSIYNRLASVAGLGQSAAANVGNSGTQLGTGIAQAQAGSAASTAGGIVGATNALGGGANSLAGMMYLNAGQGNDPTAGLSYNDNSVTSGGQTYNESDFRLKTNLVRIGTTERGNALYSWDWKRGGSSQGVIAQEVAHIKGAVIDFGGVLMVDYSKV